MIPDPTICQRSSTSCIRSKIRTPRSACTEAIRATFSPVPATASSVPDRCWMRLDCYAGDDQALVRTYERFGFVLERPFTVDTVCKLPEAGTPRERWMR